MIEVLVYIVYILSLFSLCVFLTVEEKGRWREINVLLNKNNQGKILMRVNALDKDIGRLCSNQSLIDEPIRSSNISFKLVFQVQHLLAICHVH